MGHRALIAYQEPDLSFTSRYSHWGALDAKLMGAEWEERRPGSMHGVGRHGKREVDTGLEDLEAFGQSIDFLFHEAVYTVALGKEARAYDTVWWKGAQNYVPSPGGTVGVGAVVELDSTDEWGEFSSFFQETEDMTATEFHEMAQDRWGDRIPDWSPMGGDELRVPDEYRERIEQ